MLQAGVVRLSTSITHSPGHKEGWKCVILGGLQEA